MTSLYELPFAPSVQEVADIAKTRTRNGQTGMQEPTFNSNTVPTANQVLGLISDAVSDVQVDLGVEEMPASVVPQVRSFIALVTVMKIEESYYTEQMEARGSPYKVYEKQYEKRLPKITKAVERAIEGDSEDTSVELLPHYNFPDGSNPQGMVGWGTIWG